MEDFKRFIRNELEGGILLACLILGVLGGLVLLVGGALTWWIYLALFQWDPTAIVVLGSIIALVVFVWLVKLWAFDKLKFPKFGTKES